MKALKNIAPLLLFALASLLLFLTAPRVGGFWWSDASRHAMDGVFFHDLLTALPVFRLKQYAVDYYLHYPAILVVSYPPLFPLAEALFFLVLGVSQAAAQLCETAFFFAAALGVYRLAGRWMSRWLAFACGLLFMGLHEVAFWGRQVMLEVPCCAFLIWSAYVLLRFLDERRLGYFYAFLALFGAALYTKQTAAFAAPAFAAALIVGGGLAFLRERRYWAGIAVFVAALLPLAYTSIRMGPGNIENVVGGAWEAHGRWSLEAWEFYLECLPSQVGWLVLVPSLGYLALILFQRKRRLDPRALALLSLWLAGGYVFFSLIALHEPRHTVPVLLPFAILPILLLRDLLPPRWSPVVAIAFAGVAFGHTLLLDKIPQPRGYDQAVEYLVSHAPANSVILFSGKRDGSFIFDARVAERRRSFSIIRADKLLTRVRVKRSLELKELPLSPDAIARKLREIGIAYAVIEPGFWSDLTVMQNLKAVFRTPEYRLVGSVPVTGGDPGEKQLEIYQAVGPVVTGRREFWLNVGIGNLALRGCIGVPIRECR